MVNLIKIAKDDNYDYKWSVDGNKYGDKYDITSASGFGDTDLISNGWEEVLAVNGGLFYTWENSHYACGLEKSCGVNNQDVSMSAVSDYNKAMAIAAINDQLWFGKQEWIINNKLEAAYGAITGIGLLLDGKAVTYGHSEFSSQYKTKSGRTIIGEDKDGNFLSYSIKGETGSSGITGDEATKVAQDNGFYNAIMLDGGGSVWRRYFGAYDITTTRKVKNALLLYRKKKSTADDTNESSISMFAERLSSAGIKNNKFWYDASYNKGAKSSGTMLPNCTTYCIGRSEEIANQAVKVFPNISVGGFYDAKEWYSKSDWVGSNEPVVGGILCWGASSDKYGHVAICERVLGNTGNGWKVLVSQSNYGGTFFETKEYIVNRGVKTSGVGFIYNGCLHNPYINDIRVSRDTTKAQVEVLVDLVRIRKDANGDVVEGQFAAPGIYNIKETKEAGDYTWAKLDNERWIALNDEGGWTKTYLVDNGIKTDPELENEVDELKAQINTLNSKVESLNKDITELKTQNESLTTQLNEAKQAEVIAENKAKEYKEIIDAAKIILQRGG